MSRSALEWLPIGLLIVGADGAIVLVNHELERLFGYDRQELIGHSVDVVVPDISQSVHSVLRTGFLQGPRPRVMGSGRELFGRRKDGSQVPIEVGLSPIPIDDDVFVVASVIDITERHRIQNELRAARDERLEFERLVGDLGVTFINLAPDEVDGAIADALRQIVVTLDLDRSALFQLVEERGDFVHTHQWTRPGWASPPQRVSAKEQFPWHFARIRSGELVSFVTPEEVPDHVDRESLRHLGTKSGVTIPLTIGGHPWGAVSFGAVRETRNWTADIINRLRVVALIFANALARKQSDEALRTAASEIAGRRDRLRDENTYLRRELTSLSGLPVIVGHSAAVRRVLEQARQVAPTDSPVLLHGETGTGKSLLAARIHELSARRERPMVRLNCTSLSGAWIDNELFGVHKGTYADVETRRVGRLELADRSTMFLNEVADLPLDAQASLIRVIEEKHMQPVGSTRPLQVDIRIVASTRKDLMRCIAEGTFRDDLYYLLNVFPIHLAPLRERAQDIPPLTWRFVDEFSEFYGKPIDTIDKHSMAALQRYHWPGNARELRNVVERAMIVAKSRHLRISLLGTAPRQSEKLASVEREHIISVLASSDWKIDDKDGAAARLGLTSRALRALMKKLGIRNQRH